LHQDYCHETDLIESSRLEVGVKHYVNAWVDGISQNLTHKAPWKFWQECQ